MSTDYGLTFDRFEGKDGSVTFVETSDAFKRLHGDGFKQRLIFEKEDLEFNNAVRVAATDLIADELKKNELTRVTVKAKNGANPLTQLTFRGNKTPDEVEDDYELYYTQREFGRLPSKNDMRKSYDELLRSLASGGSGE